MAGIKVSDLRTNTKLLGAALALATKDKNPESLLFLFDKGNNEGVYAKYISPKSKQQVNLSGKIQAGLDALGEAKDWKAGGWAALLKKAKEEVEASWNQEYGGSKFPNSAEYKAYEVATTPKKKADPTKAAKLLGIRDVAKLKKAMEASIEGNKATALKLLTELAKEEGLKDKNEVILKSLEKAGLI